MHPLGTSVPFEKVQPQWQLLDLFSWECSVWFGIWLAVFMPLMQQWEVWRLFWIKRTRNYKSDQCFWQNNTETGTQTLSHGFAYFGLVFFQTVCLFL